MFYDATLYMSNSKFVTLSSSIPIYNSLLEHLEKLADVNDKNYCNSSEVRIAILKSYKKLKTYYSKTDDSHTYAIATSNYIFSIFFLFDLYILYNCFFFNLLCIYNHRSTVQIRLLSETGVGTILY